ncbi:MerR family transcriptional regulator [Lysinibacillus sp. FSL K6-0232]|uniref:MerR family transcriptional regulator n=1 Tax=unclassified Lysinibacillus TaxID=2636778 RepID=UPI0030FA7B00
MPAKTIVRNEGMIIKRKWKVGELAKQTGLTVRTLHHYDQIGLFSSSDITESGHRIYTEADIVKLQQILSLKQLGFSLEEIKATIENPNFNPIEVIKIQLETVKKQIEVQEQLYSRLEGMYQLLATQQEVQSEQFIKLIEVINMSEKYFTKEQLEKMKNQTEQFSLEEKRQVENDWAELITNVRVELEKNTSPESPVVVQLAKRWQELTNKFTGGDPEIVKAAERFHAENPNNPLQYGVDGELYKYIKKAMSQI